MNRPAIETIQTGTELKRWYWLKAELLGYAKSAGLKTNGSKFELLERIARMLDKLPVEHLKSVKPSSDFDWTKEILSPETIITDNYTNGSNSRRFFEEYCGRKFNFSISLMDWMKQNVGKNLADAVTEWKRLEQLKKDGEYISAIPAGNQYNQYIRDFFVNNPDKTMDEARQCWQYKRALPLTKHRYEPADLGILRL